MGNLIDSDQGYSMTNNRKSKLFQTIKISQQQQQRLTHLIKSRGKSRSQYLCTAIDYCIGNPDDFNANLLCQQFKQLTIFYQDFDIYLGQLKQSFPLKQNQIEIIILSVCQALNFLIEGPLKTRHGDINLKMICRKGTSWKLIDNSFIRQGISAYQKVLLGQDAFISPYQMDKIRHGFVRQSPPLKQSDDIFALGMTCLQIMTTRQSKFCYKQTYARFNQNQIQQRIQQIQKKYDPNLVNIVKGMLVIKQNQRIKLHQILSHPYINRHNKKTSLKSYIK